MSRSFCQSVFLAGLLLLAPFVPLARAANTGATGGGQAFSITQPTLEMHYIIATSGTFPHSSYASDPRSDETPILGMITLFAGTFTPSGWARCDGSLLSISQNQALFALLGTTYGGNGTSTFALPDLRGRVPVGVSPERPAGSISGSRTVTLTTSQMPSHQHLIGSASSTQTSGSALPVSAYQPSLALNHLIVVDSATWESIGEIFLYAGSSSFSFPSNTQPCNGQTLPIASNAALFSRLGTNFGGNGISTFSLPNLQNRSLAGANASLPIGYEAGQSTLSLYGANLPSHNHSLDHGFGSTGSTGSGVAFNIWQPTTGINFAIQTMGIFPSQGGSYASFPLIGSVRTLARTLSTDNDPALNALNGTLLNLYLDSSLYYVIGTNYGGNGTSTFAVPNASGRLIAGVAQDSAVGTTYGSDTTTLTTAQLPSHVHTLPPAPTITTTAASDISTTQVSLNGLVNPQSGLARVYFDHGPTVSYGTATTGSPAELSGATAQSASATISGLAPGTTYHFRVRVASPSGLVDGNDLVFTTLTSLEGWRKTAFGITTGTGDAADAATPNGDGVPNLVKFAAGLPGNQPAAMPGVLSLDEDGATLRLVYTRSQAAFAGGIVLKPEWSDTLGNGTWTESGITVTPISSNAGVDTLEATIPVGAAGRRFLRLQATAP